MGFLHLYPLLTLLFFCKFCSCQYEPLATLCAGKNLTVSTSQTIKKMVRELNSTLLHDRFYPHTITENHVKIYGMGQCRGDVSNTSCLICISRAVSHIRQKCNQTDDAHIFYDNCFLRYSTVSFFGDLDSSPVITFYNTANVSNAKNFKRVLNKLMNVTVPSEAARPENKMLGKSNTQPLKKENYLTLYGLGQCSRDLEPDDCTRCLTNFANLMTESGSCVGHKGCRIVSRSCYGRYELYKF